MNTLYHSIATSNDSLIHNGLMNALIAPWQKKTVGYTCDLAREAPLPLLTHCPLLTLPRQLPPCLPSLCLCQLTMPVYPEELVLGGEGVIGCVGVNAMKLQICIFDESCEFLVVHDSS